MLCRREISPGRNRSESNLLMIIYCNEYDHLLGKGYLNTFPQQRIPTRSVQKRVLHGYRNGIDTGCAATAKKAITFTVGNGVLYSVLGQL
jgi:hypothetical protein